MTNTKKRDLLWTVILISSAVFAAFCVSALFAVVAQHRAIEAELADETLVPAYTSPADSEIMACFDALVSSSASEALDAVRNTSRVFKINENAEIAPMPDASCYGETKDLSSLQWLLDSAAELLCGQDTVFRTDIELAPGSKITYYLDESIMVITWRQILDDYVYTFSEVKVSHPSQFRRHFAENKYNSDYTHPTSRMAGMVNAVMASSADFYRARNQGIVVYEGKVEQDCYSHKIDTCFIDKNGDLILVPAGTLQGQDEIQQFVDTHNINSSIAFGPILIDNGVRCEPTQYYLGEVKDKYPRAALCQIDSLHYVVVMANGYDGHFNTPTIHMFTDQIEKLGCKNAYTLDGGKTGTISMRGTNMNPLRHKERWVSDIIYFATAIPSQP